MEFTIKAYENMLEALKGKKYNIVGYDNTEKSQKRCILRHDIDMSVPCAVNMSKVEKQHGVTSTYFVLLCTGFYNVFDKSTKEQLLQIIDNGSEIGLHFDECKYDDLQNLDSEQYKQQISLYIKQECEILQQALGIKIDKVSMHRPSKRLLSEHIQIANLINSYSVEFFEDYKYLSDSRRNWREDVFMYINEAKQDLHILTHPIWYQMSCEKDIKQTLLEFCNSAKFDRYHYLEDNIRDLNKDFKITDL